MTKKSILAGALVLLFIGTGVTFLAGLSWSNLLLLGVFAIGTATLVLTAHAYRVLSLKMTKLEDRIREEGVLTSRQVQALLDVYTRVEPRLPLPPMRHMVISPDFAATLISLVRSQAPQVILELGSGTSTLLSSYCLEKNQSGRLISLDHEARFANETRQAVQQHGLSHIAEVFHAPLKPVAIGGQTFQWYDLSALSEIPQIDLLVVDGPPAFLSKNARYPALPLLLPYLSPDATILVDDAARPDEKAIVRDWVAQFPEFEKTEYAHEKGTVLLRRRAQEGNKQVAAGAHDQV